MCLDCILCDLFCMYGTEDSVGKSVLHTNRKQTDVKPGYYRDTAAHNRWRNFQHCMARLTAHKLMYCAPWNALQDIVPSSQSMSKKPNLEHDIIAAAQWVIWPSECRYVYQECLKKETATHYWKPWSMQQWRHWKREFGVVAESAQFDDETRGVARQAVRRMEDVEEEVVDEGSAGSGND
jgi:hypothetical protein